MGQCPIASGLFEDRKLVAKYVIDREDDYIRMQYHHIDYHIFPDVEVYFCPIVLFNYRKNERLQTSSEAEWMEIRIETNLINNLKNK